MTTPKNVSRETIAAISTPPGRGGVGVIRVSGASLEPLVADLIRKPVRARIATVAAFHDSDGSVIDQGLALYFPGPHSYTGESVLELHGHGGQAVMQRLLQRCLDLGCRPAEPGEFTRRAFLNDKLDLAQAESVADLIDANSVVAAKSAARSLVGEFSKRVHELTEATIELRMHVEACIDFPEEEIDPADRQVLNQKLSVLRARVARLTSEAKQGALLREGLTVVLVGRPNVGKSSLLNKLAGEDVAIVTPIAGTTRDQVRATILIEGVPIHLIDTAGLRDTDDEVEKIGIERTWAAIQKAGAALLITEAGEALGAQEARILAQMPPELPAAWVYNKIDILGVAPGKVEERDTSAFRLSALTGEGVDDLRAWLLEAAGWHPSEEGVFMARERHLRALAQVSQHLERAAETGLAFELFAEELRVAQLALSSITGEFSADDLLGEIFGRFCIGK
jgi:tRNA modification GTPase